VKELQASGTLVGAIEQTEQTVFLHQINQISYAKIALIFGNEVDGVAQEAIDLCDHVIEVPQFGTKHSLNVSVCAGVVLWEFSKRFFD
jgi:tRNA G18 (ribose-2'-O)-methylase SpoU